MIHFISTEMNYSISSLKIKFKNLVGIRMVHLINSNGTSKHKFFYSIWISHFIITFVTAIKVYLSCLIIILNNLIKCAIFLARIVRGCQIVLSKLRTQEEEEKRERNRSESVNGNLIEIIHVQVDAQDGARPSCC